MLWHESKPEVIAVVFISPCSQHVIMFAIFSGVGRNVTRGTRRTMLHGAVQVQSR